MLYWVLLTNQLWIYKGVQPILWTLVMLYRNKVVRLNSELSHLVSNCKSCKLSLKIHNQVEMELLWVGVRAHIHVDHPSLPSTTMCVHYRVYYGVYVLSPYPNLIVTRVFWVFGLLLQALQIDLDAQPRMIALDPTYLREWMDERFCTHISPMSMPECNTTSL